jgi:YidC/Oxa1 family membrane protein insertase
VSPDPVRRGLDRLRSGAALPPGPMIRTVSSPFRRRLAALVALVVAVLAVPDRLVCQEGAANGLVVEHVFGGREPGSPGYRVRFDRRGAAILSVDLLDHDAPRLRGDEEPEPYRVVQEELRDPSRPDAGRFTWLSLREDVPNPVFGSIGLDQAAWVVDEAVEDRIRFSLAGPDGARFEREYAYDGEGRRDLRLVFRVVAPSAEALASWPASIVLRLDGIGLVAPRTDYVLGQNPAVAAGETRGGADEVVFEVRGADARPVVEQVVLARGGDGQSIAYAGNTNRFFGAFLYPAEESSQAALVRADLGKVPQVEQGDTPAFSVPVARFTLALPRPAAAAASSEVAYRLYLGPKSFRVFDERAEYAPFVEVVDQSLDPMCFCSIPGARTMAHFLLWLLGALYDVVGNWGFAIVCLTILVRGSLVPLNFKAQKAMRAYGAKMGVLKPKLDAIQTRYKNEPEVLRAKMVEFQREHKLIPPVGGCLPLFVTMPVFLGLFTALRVAYELRQQPFFGWIDDLSRPDQLFELGFGFLPWFNLLPIIMVFMWLWLQSSTPLPNDPQQRQVMKIMRYMPFMFAVMLYNYASGLMVYMITSSAFGLIEQRVTRRILGPVDPNAAGLGATPMI